MITPPKTPNPKNNYTFQTSSPQTLLDHLRELRNRLFVCLIFFFVNALIGFLYRNQLFSIFIKPLNQPLFYTTPAGGFNFAISTAIFYSLCFSIPFFVLQTISFVEPAFNATKKSKFSLSLTTFFSFFLMGAGMFFAYFVLLPASLNFLKQFGTENINSIITANSYLSFVSRYVLSLGFLFQLPLIVLFINKTIGLKVKTLIKIQKWVFLLSFIIAAILTPTSDFINQSLLAFPLIVLYQISIILVLLSNRKRKPFTRLPNVLQ